ncbi:MAG: hypothetical protein ACWA41_00790 [Putridiphycobacter sp.]
MKLFKQFDNYLLRNHPNIWITRVHIFLPIGLILFALIFAFNAFVISYNIQEDFPRSESSVFLMVIPILVYLVYWFVFQARYNVEKSGGKLNFVQEYVNYFLYFSIFFIAYLLIIVIPLSNEYKIYKSVPKEKVFSDLKKLNKGHAFFNYSGNNVTVESGKYTYHQIELVSPKYYSGNSWVDNWDYYYEPDYHYGEEITVTRNQLKQILTDYIDTYNQYAHPYNQIHDDPDEMITYTIDEGIDNGYGYDYYDYMHTNVEKKFRTLVKLNNTSWLHDFVHYEVFLAVIAVLAMLALMVWIFKQIHWKHYVFGLVSLALTPMVFGIFGLIYFEMFRLDDQGFANIFLIAYIAVIIIVILGVMSNKKNHTAIVAGMYLQIFLPFIGILFAIYMDDRRDLFPDIETIYWSGWVIGLISIPLFKLFYRKTRLLPEKK